MNLQNEFSRGTGWKIVSKALNQSHGEDIRATKNGAIMIVEAKGSRGNPNNPNVVRSEFDSSQIKDHLGKAIVKVLELKTKEPDAILVIAHPNSPKIQKIIFPIAQHLQLLGISFAFVESNESIEWIRCNNSENQIVS